MSAPMSGLSRVFYVDDEPWVMVEVKPSNAGWLELLSKRHGTHGGPTNSFTVPTTSGRFRTSGHDFDFERKPEPPK